MENILNSEGMNLEEKDDRGVCSPSPVDSGRMTPFHFAEITDLVFEQNNCVTLLTGLVRYMANGLYANYASAYFLDMKDDKEHFLFSTADNPQLNYVEIDAGLRISNKKCGGCICDSIRSGNLSQKSFQCNFCENSKIGRDSRIIRFPFRTHSFFGVFTIAQDASCCREFHVDVLIHAILVLVVEKINSLELEEKNEELVRILEEQQSLKELGENSTYVLHETKNLVSSIYGGVQLAQEQILRIFNDKENRFTAKSAKAFSSLSESISLSMRAGNKFSKILEGWKSNLNSEEWQLIHLNSLVESSISEAKACRRSNLRFIYEDSGNELYVKTNPTLLDRAIANIILNSINALCNVDNPTISIKLQKAEDNDFIQVIIKDNGSGIPKDKIDHVMNNKPPSAKAPSFSGKGMWITKAITDALGCTLKIRSDSASGSEVTIEIPASSKP